jgi:peptidoglycan hydrolase CwlO-like protein
MYASTTGNIRGDADINAATTDGEHRPLIDSPPGRRGTNHAKWAGALLFLLGVFVAALVGVATLSPSGALMGDPFENLGDSADIAPLGCNFRCWRRRASRARRELSSLKNQVNDAANQVTSLKNHLTSLANQATTLTNKANSLTSQVTSIQNLGSIEQLRDNTLIPSSLRSRIAGYINDASSVTNIKNMAKLKDLQNNALIPQAVKNAISSILGQISDLKKDASNLVDDVAETLGEVNSIVADATDLVEAIKDAPEKLFDNILDKVIPTNANNLKQMMKVPAFNAKAGLGASAPSILLPENEHQLRGMIRAALGVASLEDIAVESVSDRHERLSASDGNEAALGDDDGACVALEIPVFAEFQKLTEYEMPWPEKLQDDAFAPDALEINLPGFTFNWCVKPEFEFPMSAASALVDAFVAVFSDVIHNAIDLGLDAVSLVEMQEVKNLATQAKAKLECVKGIVNDVKGLADNLEDTFGRRLLAEDSAALGCASHLGLAPHEITRDAMDDPASPLRVSLRDAHVDALALVRKHSDLKQHKMAKIEDSVFNSVSLLQHVFSRSDFGAVGADGAPVDHLGHAVAARLGFDFSDSKDKFEEALLEMKNVKFGFTLTRRMSFSTGVKVTNGLFRHGDLMDIFDPSGTKRGFVSLVEIGIPSVPIISAYTGIDVGFSLPYFFKADSSGEYTFEVEVENKMFFGISDGSAGSKTYDPVVSVNNGVVGSVGASLQVGASMALNEYTSGVCVLFVCTGPRLGLQQDVYLGFDVLAAASAGDAPCVDGANELSTTFTDWDYSQSDKERCRLKKGGSFLMGGYLQIPRMTASLVMTTSLGTHGPGYDKPWEDFELEKMMYGSDADAKNFYANKLFDPICQSTGSSILETCDAPEETCLPTKMVVDKNIEALPDTSLAGTQGEYPDM